MTARWSDPPRLPVPPTGYVRAVNRSGARCAVSSSFWPSSRRVPWSRGGTPLPAWKIVSSPLEVVPEIGQECEACLDRSVDHDTRLDWFHAGPLSVVGKEQATVRHLDVPPWLPLKIEVTGAERWPRKEVLARIRTSPGTTVRPMMWVKTDRSSTTTAQTLDQTGKRGRTSPRLIGARGALPQRMR